MGNDEPMMPFFLYNWRLTTRGTYFLSEVKLYLKTIFQLYKILLYRLYFVNNIGKIFAPRSIFNYTANIAPAAIRFSTRGPSSNAF